MELLVALLVGIVAGAVVATIVVLGRADAERRRRQAAVDAELAAARMRAERATSEAQALRTRLATGDALATRVVALEGELATARVELEAFRGSAVRGRARRPDGPAAAQVPPVTSTVSPATAEPRVTGASPAKELASATAVPPVLVTAAAPMVTAEPTVTNGTIHGEDDLERIHGVGPYLAARLRQAGIVTWRQVAEWDDDDMTAMSRRIGSFPDRIRREDWPASARALHEAAYGEVLPGAAAD